MKKIKTLLIGSAVDDPYVRERYRNAGVFLAPPLGLYRLKCYIENIGLGSVDIFDPNLHRDDMLEKMKRHLNAHDIYNIIGFSPTHVNLGYDLNLFWAVYNHYHLQNISEPLYIAGGNEATNNYEKLFEEFPPLKIAVLGPGERPLENIIRKFALQNDGNLPLDFRAIPGTVWINPESLQLERCDAIPEDLKTFQEMAFENDPTHLIPYQHYWEILSHLYSEKNLASRGATLKCVRLFTTNHCKMQCHFCTSRAFHENACGGSKVPVVRLTPEQMIHIIKKCWTIHQPDGFYFNDDDFISDSVEGRKRVIDFCQIMATARKENQLWANISLYCQTQASWLTQSNQRKLIPDMELINSMKEGGFKLICMGVENMSDRLLKAESICKSYSPSHAKIAVEGLLKVGIIPLLNIILFPPEVQEEDILINIKECGAMISKGVIISMQEFIEVFPGSVIHRSITERAKNMEIIYDTVSILATGRSIRSNERLLPENKEMRAIACGLYTELNEVNRYLLKKAWFPFDVTPKHLNALAMLMATAGLLKKDDEVNYLEEIAHSLCEQYRLNSCVNVEDKNVQ